LSVSVSQGLTVVNVIVIEGSKQLG